MTEYLLVDNVYVFLLNVQHSYSTLGSFSFLHFIPLSTNKSILPRVSVILPTFPFFHLTNVKRKNYLYVYSDPTSIRNFKVMTNYSNFRPATQDKTVLEIEKVFQVKGYLVDEIWCLTNKDWASFIQRLSSPHVFTNSETTIFFMIFYATYG